MEAVSPSTLGSFGEDLPVFTVDLKYECCIPDVCFSAERRDLRMKQEAVAGYEVESLSCPRLCKMSFNREGTWCQGEGFQHVLNFRVDRTLDS